MTIKINMKSVSIKSIGVVIAIAIIWIIFGLNYSNPDYESYRIIYDYGAIGTYSRIEWGFLLVCRVAKMLGLSYAAFRAVLGMIGLLLIKNSLEKYTNNPIPIMIGYFMYPFFFEAIQIRMFIVSAIMLFSVRYLEEYSKKNVIKFVVCVLVAVSFQTVAIFYLILLMAYIKDLKTVFFVSVGVTILELLVFNQTVILKILSSFTILGENFALGTRYVSFDSDYRRLMWIYIILDVITIMVVLFLDFWGQKKNLSIEINQYGDLLKKLLFISLIATPLFEIGSSWGRVFRSLLPIIYCSIVDYPVEQNRTIQRYLKCIFLFAFSFVLFYSHVLTGSNDTYTRVFRAMIENNYIYDFLFR